MNFGTAFKYRTRFLLQIASLMNFTWSRVTTTPGNLLAFKNLPDRFCVRIKTGYRITYLSRNWSPYFIIATAPMLYKMHVYVLYLAQLHRNSRFDTLHSRPKQCKHVLDFSWNPSWNLLEICSVKFVDTLWSNEFCLCLLWYRWGQTGVTVTSVYVVRGDDVFSVHWC